MKTLARCQMLLTAAMFLWVPMSANGADRLTDEGKAASKKVEKTGKKDEDAAKKEGSGSVENPPAQATDQNADMSLDRAQPDFTIITLPTTLRLPKHKSAFRVTHRFTRPLGQGDFGDLVSDFFGIDLGALIGLEYRFGLLPGTQVGIHRTSDRTIQLFGQYNFVQQNDKRPLSLDALLSVEGTNNFRDEVLPSLGVVVSRKIGEHAALYAEPIWVGNSNGLREFRTSDNDTFMIGLGARLHIRPEVYLVGEFVPRVAGYDPGVNHATFGIEKRVGGHMFQLNFSNSFGTTRGQIARGGRTNDDWFLGFNISRKFF